MGSDHVGDKADHTLAVSVATTDAIYQSALESNYEGSGKVYMAENGEDLPNKTVEEILHEAEEEIARLVREAKRGKRHNNL
jgi:hypothetical protein